MSEPYKGTVTSGKLSVSVLPLINGDAGRLLISIALHTDPSSLLAMIANSTTINTGPNLLATAIAFSVFCNVESALRKTVSDSKNYGFVAAKCFSSCSHFNICVDFAGKATKILGGLKVIMRNFTPNRSAWREAIRLFVDADGKKITPSGDDYHASCALLKSAMNKIEVLASGKVVVKKVKDSTARQRVEAKVESAADVIKDISCDKATATKFSHTEPSFGNRHVHKVSGGLDFFWIDARKQLQISGCYVICQREMEVDKSAYADRIIGKLKDKLEAYVGYTASAIGCFSAGDLKVYLGSVKKSDITKSV